MKLGDYKDNNAKQAVPGEVLSTPSSPHAEAGIKALGAVRPSEWALLYVCWDTTGDSILSQ